MGTRHPKGMKTTQMWKGAAQWLLGRNETRAEGCSVQGCQEKRTVAVAGDDSGTTLMCTRHAVEWTESTLCRDFAQHNSDATFRSLSSWLGIREVSQAHQH
jgi:hypothetical protein